MLLLYIFEKSISNKVYIFSTVCYTYFKILRDEGLVVHTPKNRASSILLLLSVENKQLVIGVTASGIAFMR
jgi:hypothetical protein